MLFPVWWNLSFVERILKMSHLQNTSYFKYPLLILSLISFISENCILCACYCARYF
jgi:hypothetical protein